MGESGTDLYISIYDNGVANWIQHWELSTAWDVSTATLTTTKNLTTDTGETGTGRVCRIRNSGTKLYWSNGNNKIYQWTLGTAYDLSTNVTYDGGSNFTGISTALRHFDISNDGTKLVTTHSFSSPQYFAIELGTAWDVTTNTTTVNQATHNSGVLWNGIILDGNCDANSDTCLTHPNGGGTIRKHSWQPTRYLTLGLFPSTFMEVYSSFDETGSATAINTGGSPNIYPASVAWTYNKYLNEIYIAVSNINSIDVYRLNLTSEVWTLDNFGDVSGKEAPDEQWISIECRDETTRDLVVVASGLVDTSMGSDYQRVDLWHGPFGGTITGPVSIDAGFPEYNERFPTVFLSSQRAGDPGDLHILYKFDKTTAPARAHLAAKTFNPSNNFSTRVAPGTGEWPVGGEGVSWDLGLQGQYFYPSGATVGDPQLYWGQEDANGDVQTLTGDKSVNITFTTDCANTAAANGEPGKATVALDTVNENVYMAWIDDTAGDVYLLGVTISGFTQVLGETLIWDSSVEGFTPDEVAMTYSAEAQKLYLVYSAGTHRLETYDLASGQTIALGTASETDTADAVTADNPRSYDLTTSSETETAGVLTPFIDTGPVNVDLLTSSETDAAGVLTPEHLVGIGTAGGGTPFGPDELVTNGEFATDLSGWTTDAGDGSVLRTNAYGDGELYLEHNSASGSNEPIAGWPISFVSGVTYKANATLEGSDSVGINMRFRQGATLRSSTVRSTSTAGPSGVQVSFTELTFVADFTGDGFLAFDIISDGGTDFGYVDAVSVTEEGGGVTDTAGEITPAYAVAIGTASETDSGESITPAADVVASLSTASETDTSGVLTPATPVVAALGTAAEVDTSGVLTDVNPRSYELGTSAETETAGQFTADNPRSYELLTSSEADTADAFTVVNPRSYALETSAETDTAGSISASQDVFASLGTASETDTAGVLTDVNPRAYEVGTSAESDSAGAVGAINPRSYALDTSSETDAAGALTPAQAALVSVNTAAETDTADTFTVVNPRSYDLLTSSETDQAGLITDINTRTYPLATSSESDTAGSIAPAQAVLATIGTSSETDTAGQLTDVNPRSYELLTASESDSAGVLTPALDQTVVLSTATESDSAGAIADVNPRSYEVGTSTEADTAGAIDPQAAAQTVLGTASEVDTGGSVQALEPAMQIVDIDLDDKVFDTQVAVIHGIRFGAVQGEVYISGVPQAVSNWSDTEITITVDQGGLSLGAQSLVVRKAA